MEVMRGFKESTAHIKEVRRTQSGAKCSLLSPTGHHDEGNAQPLIQLAEALRVHGPGPVAGAVDTKQTKSLPSRNSILRRQTGKSICIISGGGKCYKN